MLYPIKCGHIGGIAAGLQPIAWGGWIDGRWWEVHLYGVE